MVIGNVAENELVKKAVSNADNIVLKCIPGETPTITRNTAGRNKNAASANKYRDEK